MPRPRAFICSSVQEVCDQARPKSCSPVSGTRPRGCKPSIALNPAEHEITNAARGKTKAQARLHGNAG